MTDQTQPAEDGCGSGGAQHGLSDERQMAFSALMRGHASLLTRLARRLEADGVYPLEWYDVLLSLEKAPGGCLRVGELGCHVSVSRSGLTRLLDRLEEAGLVERRATPQDRRAFEIVLTGKGRAARESSWPIGARAIAETFGNHYTEEEARTLCELMTRQIIRE